MATKKTGTTAKGVPLDPKVVDRLLERLGTDNEFRRLFKKDSAAALAKAGYAGPALDNTSLACMSVTRIAPKQEILAARDTLGAHLTSLGAHTIPHCFEAGRIASTLKRR